MVLSKSIKAHLAEIAFELAQLHVAACVKVYEEDEYIHADDPLRNNLRKFTRTEWEEEGYEYLDDIAMAVDKLVEQQIKTLTRGFA